LAAKNEELENEVALRIDAEAKANAANQAKSDFLSFISHEMRSPLNAIIGFSEELTESLDTADQVEPLEDAKSIRRSAEHLLGLINHLLDLSKIEAGMMTLDLGTFPPLALTTSLIKDLEPLAKKQANALTLSQGGWEGEIVSDAGKLKQVLMNLISNACKFTEKGRVALSIDVADPVESRPSFCIRVADSGIGMSAAQMEGLFQPYQQVASSPSRRHEGTGLGLSISRQLCRLMGGDLTVESQAGQGSTFTVTLPIKIESPEE
jgi:signal transduction histidine kinase